MQFKLPLAVSAAVLLSACGGGGGSSTSATPTTSIAGNYTGSIHDNIAGAGTLTLNLSQSGSVLSGTFADSFNVSSNNDAGSVTGTVSGTSVQMTLTSDGGVGCPFTFSGTVSGTTITGTYAATNCSTADGGSLTATLQ